MRYADEASIVGFAIRTRNDNGDLFVTCPEGRVNIQPELMQFAELIEAKAEKNLLQEMDDILLREYQKLVKAGKEKEDSLEIYEAMINKIRSLSRTATTNIKKAATTATFVDF
jgi:hypothetical protein